MGANQSSSAGGSNDPAGGARRGAAEVKTCYYELLEVDLQASEDEIKRAYRKKALELHPDRNYGNVEETTKLFAAVQSAYEILSDPQERAWYDTHRDAILREEEDTSGEHYDHNVRITTADDILRMFTRFHGKIDYSDSATGFYGFLRESFDTIAREEELASQWEGLEAVAYPSFGHADDNYEDVVKSFYAVWNGFATRKTFSWEDVYRYSEAPDRRVRRLMEKENKRFREEGIAKFNSAVRSLVAFVKKRDSRYKPNVQTEAERQKALRDAAVAQAARSRAANQAKHIQPETVPEWMKFNGAEEDDVFEEAEEALEERFECVVCRKSFKSEKQYEAHEKSKKHVKAVQHLSRQMQQEDKTLHLDEFGDRNLVQPTATPNGPDGSSLKSEDEGSHSEFAATGDRGDSDESSYGSSEVILTKDSALERGLTQDDSSAADRGPDCASSSEDDIYTSRKEVEARLFPRPTSAHDLNTSNIGVDVISDKPATESPNLEPKVGKAKEKRAKKAAQKSSTAVGSGLDFKCAACQAGFPSKTRLFNHIKDFGHAQPVSKPAKGGKGKKR